MKNTFALGFIALACALVPAQAGTFTLTLNSPVTAGDNFDATLTFRDAFGGRPEGDLITILGFDVNLNSSIAQFLGITAGSLFDDASAPPDTPDVLLFADNPSGFGPLEPGYTDPLTIATLHFKALTAGTTAINITTDTVSDPNQGLYYSTGDPIDFSAGSEITVDAPATPEPGTFGMLGLAGAGLWAVWNRRQRAR